MFADQLADARLIVNDQDFCHRTDPFLRFVYFHGFIILQEWEKAVKFA